MLLGEVLSKPNMTRAYDRVVGNGGAAGTDKMPVSMLKAYLQESWTALKAAIETGNYEPQAVRRVTIPKPNGG